MELPQESPSEPPKVEELDEDVNQSDIGIYGIRDLSKAFKRRLKLDYDVAVAITGSEGEGKSTLAIQLARDLDKEFNLKRNVLFDPDLKQLHSLIYTLPKFSGIVIDETIRVAYKRKWQSANNIFLNELYTLCRYRNQASFFCIPRFNQLDSDMQKRVLFWIHVPQRGIAIVLKKDDNQFSADPWNVKQNYKLLNESLSTRGYRLLDKDIARYLTAASRLPNFVAIIKFEPLSEEVKAEYTSLKKPFEVRGDSVQETSGGKRFEVWRNAVRNCIVELYRHDWKQQKLADLTGINIRIINDFLKEAGARPQETRKLVAPRMFLKEDVVNEGKQEKE